MTQRHRAPYQKLPMGLKLLDDEAFFAQPGCLCSVFLELWQ